MAGTRRRAVAAAAVAVALLAGATEALPQGGGAAVPAGGMEASPQGEATAAAQDPLRARVARALVASLDGMGEAELLEMAADLGVVADAKAEAGVANATALDEFVRRENVRMRAYSADPDAAPVPDGCAGAYPGLCRMRDRRETVARVPAAEMTRERFERDHVRARRPVVVEGLVQHLGWPALARWRPERLAAEHGDEPFEFRHKAPREDAYCYVGDFESTLGGYLARMRELDANGTRCQRSFAGVIDDGLVDTPGRRAFHQSYWAPPVLADGDLFAPITRLLQGLGAPESFSHRYMVLGAGGSGTTLHKDFLDTAFWNACVVGSKRWVLFPPLDELVPRHVSADEYDVWQRLTNFEWFEQVYPQLEARGIPHDEFTQRAGDVLWAPPGWPHQTINRQASVTVTHNTVLPADAARTFRLVCEHPWGDATQEEGLRMRPEHAIYLCVALARLFPRVYSGTCCATRAFADRLDQEGSVHATSMLDFEPNSDFYRSLLRRVRDVRVRADGSPVLDEAGGGGEGAEEPGSDAEKGSPRGPAPPAEGGQKRRKSDKLRRFDATLL